MSLKQEAISYMAGSELPGVIVNVSRGGPGLGDIGPSQGDYFQSVKGGGHGDYKLLVLAPGTVQEAYDLTIKAFDLAFKYRIGSCGRPNGERSTRLPLPRSSITGKSFAWPRATSS